MRDVIKVEKLRAYLLRLPGSQAGDWMMVVLLPVMVDEILKSATYLIALRVWFAVSVLLLSSLSTHLTRGVPYRDLLRKVCIFSSAGMLLFAGITALQRGGWFSIAAYAWILFGIQPLLAISMTLFDIAMKGVTTQIGNEAFIELPGKCTYNTPGEFTRAKEAFIGRIVQMRTVGSNVARMVGGGGGGFLIAWLGYSVGIALNGLSFLLMLKALGPIEAVTRKEAETHLTLVGSIKRVWNDKTLTFMILTEFFEYLGFCVFAFLPRIVGVQYSGDTNILALLLVASGFGAIIGNFIQLTSALPFAALLVAAVLSASMLLAGGPLMTVLFLYWVAQVFDGAVSTARERYFQHENDVTRDAITNVRLLMTRFVTSCLLLIPATLIDHGHALSKVLSIWSGSIALGLVVMMILGRKHLRASFAS